MYLEVKRSFGSTRKRRPALYAVGHVGGRRTRQYIGQVPNCGDGEPFETRLVPGRPRAMPEVTRRMFEMCGYTVDGVRISMCLRRFFSMDAALSRYQLLGKEHKAAVKQSPEFLLFLEKAAYKLLKSCNSRGLDMKYPDCFLKVFLDNQLESRP